MTRRTSLGVNLSIAIATGLLVWSATRASTYWISEHELSEVALLSLQSDAAVLRQGLADLRAAIARYQEEHGAPPESLGSVVQDTPARCGTLPAGFSAWSSECETHHDDLGWFGFKLVAGKEPSLSLHGCRWFGSKLGCITFPDPGPPQQCEWCASRSRAIDGWRVTLEPAPPS